MTHYIVCHRKRNNPRMDVRICQKQCNSQDDCKEYISYLKILVQNRNEPLSIGSPSMPEAIGNQMF
jgi:hypothetical protein